MVVRVVQKVVYPCNMEYDVYYSTGGLNMIGGGADVWVNRWLEMIPQHLKTESKLLIHRTRPPGHQPDCPMEVHWQGHDRKKFKELMDNPAISSDVKSRVKKLSGKS